MEDHSSGIQQSEKETSPRRDLYLSYSNPNLSHRKKRKLVEALEEIYGYDLVLIISMILENEIEGYLNIVSEENEISGISFVKGGIAKVDLSDKESLFGNMIVSEGIISKEELDQLLKKYTTQIGEALVREKKITSEQISDLLLKQMRLRLSKYITSKKFRFNFIENSDINSNQSISAGNYMQLAHDWVMGRFSDDWLKSNYFEWENDYIVWNSKKDSSVLSQLPIFQTEPELINQFKTKIKIYDLLEKNKTKGNLIYKILHLLVSFGFVYLEINSQATNEEKSSQMKRIYLILKDKKGSQLLSAISDIVKCSPDKYETVYNLFNDIINVNTSEADTYYKNELAKMSLDVLVNSKKYLEELQKNNKDAAVTATAVKSKNIGYLRFDANLIRKNILAGDYYGCFVQLKEFNRTVEPIPKVKLYMLWAKMASMAYGNNKFGIKDLEKDLLQTLPEDKYTADYYYVMGILALIKKDMNSVNSNYNLAVKQDAFFKDYPIKKKDLISQIKGFVGLKSILIFMFCSFFLNKAYTIESDLGTQANQNSAEVAQSQLKDSEKPPIALLNQYYQYEISANNELFLSGKKINPDMLGLSMDEKKINVNVSSLDEYVDNNFVLYFVNGKSEISWKKVYEVKKHDPLFFPAKFLDQKYICYETKNIYSAINICRSLESFKNNQMSSNGNVQLTIDGQSMEKKGVVVLKSSQSDVTFDVRYANEDYVRILAKRRPVVVAKIRKDAHDRNLNVQFLEDRRGGIAWYVDINMDTTTIDLPADRILNYKQDIYYTDPELEEKPVNGTYANLLKYGVIANNKLGTELMMFYNDLSGSGSSVASAKLLSDLSMGIRFFYQNNLDEHREWYASFSYYKTTIREEENLIPIENPSQSFMHLFGGYKYHFDNDWAVAGELALKQELFFLPNADQTGVSLSTNLNKVISLAPEWTTLDSRKWNLITFFGLRYIMGGGDIKSGTQYDVNFRFSYKFNWGRLFASLQYGKRDQGIEDLKISEQYINTSVGFYYLF